MAIQFSLTFKAVERSVFVDDLVTEDIVDFYGQGWRGWKCVRIRKRYGGFCFVLFLLFFFFLNLIITIISERWFKELIALQIR